MDQHSSRTDEERLIERRDDAMRTADQRVRFTPIIIAFALTVGLGLLLLSTDWVVPTPTPTTSTSEKVNIPPADPIAPPRPEVTRPATPQ
jgi:hypothetical protein